MKTKLMNHVTLIKLWGSLTTQSQIQLVYNIWISISVTLIGLILMTQYTQYRGTVL